MNSGTRVGHLPHYGYNHHYRALFHEYFEYLNYIKFTVHKNPTTIILPLSHLLILWNTILVEFFGGLYLLLFPVGQRLGIRGSDRNTTGWFKFPVIWVFQEVDCSVVRKNCYRLYVVGDPGESWKRTLFAIILLLL